MANKRAVKLLSQSEINEPSERAILPPFVRVSFIVTVFEGPRRMWGGEKRENERLRIKWREKRKWGIVCECVYTKDMERKRKKKYEKKQKVENEREWERERERERERESFPMRDVSLFLCKLIPSSRSMMMVMEIRPWMHERNHDFSWQTFQLMFW